MNKVSPTTIIQDYVKNRSLPVTRQEIISGTLLSKDQVRKATNDLVNKGRLATELDEMGVTRYLSPEANMKIAESLIVMDELEGVSEEAIDAVIASINNYKPPRRVDYTLVEEAEERGFAKGYAVGVQEAQRAAYELGKRAVLGKLESLLS